MKGVRSARWRVLPVVAVALLGVACTLAEDVTPPGFENAAPSEAPAHPNFLPSAAEGAAVYAEHCAACHGAAGAGDGPRAAQLPSPPANFAAPDLARQRSPAEWFGIVTDGDLERLMPPFGGALSEAERWNVVYYLYTLSTPPEAMARGQETYDANCARCHGEDGQGRGPDAASSPRPLPNLADAAHAASLSQAQIVAAMTGGDAAHNFGDALSEDERWNAAAYVQTFQYTSGPSTAAVEAGQVTGTVTNGTAGAALPNGLEVTLHGFDELQEAVSLTAPVSADGSYRFDGVEMAPGRSFIATVEYLGVVYPSELVTAGSGPTGFSLPVTVYETTGDPSAVRIEQMHVALQRMEGGLLVGELMTFGNGGDRTYVGSDPQGRTLWIDLPAGATELSIQSGELGGRFQQTASGFADTAPLRPGPNSGQLLFSFQLPLGARLNFEQPLRYPASGVTVLMPEGGPRFRSEQFRAGGRQNVQGETYLSFEASNLAAGETVRFTLSGLPVELLIGLGAFLLALLGVGYAWFRVSRAAPRPGATPAAAPDRDADELVRAMAELDDAYEAGRVSEPEYRARRAELKHAAVERWSVPR